MEEFEQVGTQECGLDAGEHQKEGRHKPQGHAPPSHPESYEDGGHQHRNGDCKAIRPLHMGRRAEDDHREHAADKQEEVDRGDVKLPLDGRGVFDFQTWPEIEVDSLGEDSERAADECLRRDDGGPRRHYDADQDEPSGHYGVEGVDAARSRLRVV